MRVFTFSIFTNPNHLLSMTKGKVGHCSRVQLNRTIISAVGAIVPRCDRQNTILDYRSPKVIHYVCSNRRKLIEVLRRLFYYAVKIAGNQGRVLVEQKRIRGNRHNDARDFVKVSIRICGRGLSQEMLQAISDRLQQMNDSLACRRPPMNRFTLSTCKDFIRSAGGNIWVKGKPGSGLDFHLTIPMLKEIELKTRKRARRSETVKVIPPAGEVPKPVVKVDS